MNRTPLQLYQPLESLRHWGSRVVMAAGSQLFPRKTAELGLDLFLTPRRTRRKEYEEALVARSERIDFPEGLAVWKTGEGGPRALLVHGWDGRGSQLGEFVPLLLEQGYEVIFFDFPGHGESEGHKTHLVEWTRILDLLWTSFGGFRLIIGHSLGGSAALLAQELSEQFRPTKIVSIGAPNYFPDIFHRFCDRVGLRGQASRYFFQAMEEISNGRSPHVIFPSSLSTKGLADVLVLHAPEDREVSFEHAIQIASGIKKARLVKMSGLGHRRILRSPLTGQWISEFL